MAKTKEQIAYNMKRVRNKDSKMELLLRKELWKRGLRYRKNTSKVYGRPDIAFMGKKIAIFCDSEFWHGFDWKNRKQDFKSNRDYWLPKIERNMQRDDEVNAFLRDEGWTVLRFWGKEILRDTDKVADDIERVVRGIE